MRQALPASSHVTKGRQALPASRHVTPTCRHQGGLLAAPLGGCGGDERHRLAVQSAILPQHARRVEEILHLGTHHSESTRRVESTAAMTRESGRERE